MPSHSQLRTAALLAFRRALAALCVLLAALTGFYLVAVDGPLVATLTGGEFLGYLGRLFTFDLGSLQTVHTSSWVATSGWNIYVPDRGVGAVLARRLPSLFWLMGVVLVLSLPALAAGVFSGVRSPARAPGLSVGGVALRVVPVFFLAELFVMLLSFSDRLFNFDWKVTIVETPTAVLGLSRFPDVTTVHGFLVATKWAIPPGLAAATVVAPTLYRVGQAAAAQAETGAAAAADGPAAGIDVTGTGRYVVAWLVELAPTFTWLLAGSALVAEVAVKSNQGLGRLLGAMLYARGGTGLAEVEALASLFLLALAWTLLLGVLRVPVLVLLVGQRRLRQSSLAALSPPPAETVRERHREFVAFVPAFARRSRSAARSRLRRLAANPWPAVGWLAGAALLLSLELGAVLDVLANSGIEGLPRLPTLVSKTTIPDADYWSPERGWVGGALGLSARATWFLRAGTAVAYSATVVAWGWLGWRLTRSVYASVERPIAGGATLRMLTDSRRVQVAVVVLLLVAPLGLFAPGTNPSLANDPTEPYSDQEVTYYDETDGQLESLWRFIAWTNVLPDGTQAGTAGPLEYDRYDRFHPLGTIDFIPRSTGYDPGRIWTDDINYPKTLDLYTHAVGGLKTMLWMGGLFLAFGSGLAVVLVGVASLSRRADAVLGVLADAVLVLPVLFAAAYVSVAGYRETGGALSPLVGWVDAVPFFDAHHALLAVLVGMVAARAARRRLYTPFDPEAGEGVLARFRRAAPAVAGYACLATAGVLVVVLLELLLANSAVAGASFGGGGVGGGATGGAGQPYVIGFDPRIAVRFTWIDTAMWYVSVVPYLLFATVPGALAVLGDGIRSWAGHRADHESHDEAERIAGGGGA